MMPDLLEPLRQLSMKDALDIVILAFLIYNLLLLIKGTRAMQMTTGIVVLVLGYYVANLFELRAFRRFLEEVLFYFPFAVIVLFQTELRKALASFAHNPLTRRRERAQEEEETTAAIVKAAQALSSRRIGALILIERHHSLKQYADTGVLIGGRVSYDLLVNTFYPNTPLHDGAVIVRGSTVVAASCFVPLTQNPRLTQGYGSRHRAAIGITEETDALAIVISEESGGISFAVRGHLQRQVDGRSLRDLLRRYREGEGKS